MKRHDILLGEAGTSSLGRLHMASGDADSAESAQQLQLVIQLKLLHDLPDFRLAKSSNFHWIRLVLLVREKAHNWRNAMARDGSAKA